MMRSGWPWPAKSATPTALVFQSGPWYLPSGLAAGRTSTGLYALAAGVYVLRGVKPPADLFDPDRERAILEVMVREGPLVDGVTGQQTATVDGLSWDEYAKPLVRIREILES